MGDWISPGPPVLFVLKLRGSKNRGFENADRWRDLIKILHFTAVLRMFLTSENPRPRMALKMCLKHA